MKLRHLLPFAVIPLAAALHVVAAPQEGPEAGAPPSAGALRKEVRQYFAARLRAELGLNDEQAAAVLPKLEQLEEERRTARRDRRDLLRQIRLGLREGASDEELRDRLERLETLDDPQRARVRAILRDVDRSLSVRQQVKLRFFLVRFQQQVARRVEELRGERGRGRQPGRMRRSLPPPPG